MAKKILVVDDERHIVRLIRVNLERAGYEYEVVAASDGKEALEQVDQEKPDLVFLDIMMRYMDGFEVLQNLRKNPTTRELPVVLLPPLPPDGVPRTWQSDDDCYLYYMHKPFYQRELILLVKRIFAAQDGTEE